MRISIRYKQTKGWRNLDLKKAVLSTYIKTFGFSIHILVWPLMLTTNENGLRWLFPNLYIFNLTSYFLRLSVSFFFLRDAICESFSVSLFIVNTTLSISFFFSFFLSFHDWPSSVRPPFETLTRQQLYFCKNWRSRLPSKKVFDILRIITYYFTCT